MSVTMEMIPCPGNWTVVTQFIDSYNPQYFYNRPWIIGGLLTLAVIGLVGNCSVVLFLFQSSKAWKSAFTLLVMQLALADGLVCLFCLLADAIWNVTMEWTGGTHLCRFVKYMQMFSLYSSTMILTGMTVERCITLTHPLTMSRPQSAMYRAKLISLAVWLLASLCSIPQAVIFHVERAPICADFFQCVTFGAYTEAWQEVAYTMSTLCIMFLIPLIIIISCYITIFIKISPEAKLALRKRRQDTSPGQAEIASLTMDSAYGRQIYRRTRRFSLWTTFFIAIVFILCWAPYYLSMTAYLFNFEISNAWMTLILSFGMTSTVLNPLIHGVFHLLRSKRNIRIKRESQNLLFSRFWLHQDKRRHSNQPPTLLIQSPIRTNSATI